MPVYRYAPARVAGLIAVLVAAACVLGSADTGRDDGYAATGQSLVGSGGITDSQVGEPDTGDTAELAAVLARRASAMVARDRAAFLATVAEQDSAFGLRQRAAYDLFGQLPIHHLAYRDVTVHGLVLTATGFYHVTGFDAGEHTFRAAYRVRHDAAGWSLVAEASGNRPQLWDMAGARPLSGGGVLLVGALPQARMRHLHEQARRALEQVGTIWRAPWRQRLVVLAPKTTQEAAVLLGTGATDLSGVAAVTDGPLEAGTSAPADRVVVEPTGFWGLTDLGRQVVLRHEATHVAVRASTTGPVPLWLSEGLAEYIGYADVQLPVSSIAGPLFQAIGRTGIPSNLPTDAAFDVTGPELAVPYNESWIALGHLARSLRPDQITTLYRAAATPSADDASARTDAALRRYAGVSLAELTSQWQQELRGLAGQSTTPAR
ncbi:MAG: hypothetical protein ACK5MP_08530 [Nostocoides sp.]